MSPSATTPPRLAVRAEPAGDAELRAAAAHWARRLKLPDLTPTSNAAAPSPPAEAEADMLLLVTPEGLALRALHGPENVTRGKPMRIDLHRLDTTSGHGRSLRQPLMRAVGLRKGDPHRPSVLDATAGFGEDAWLLARAGCRVRAVERHRIVAAMLQEAIERAASDVSPPPAIDVITGDSRTLLEQLATRRAGMPAQPAQGKAPEQPEARTEAPEVVYIDPMFPPGRKTAERKAMALLRVLVGADPDADALLAVARRAARRRVVVKRARRAPPLAGALPAASHTGRGVRYDVYPALPPATIG